jgi:hypothetical protein
MVGEPELGIDGRIDGWGYTGDWLSCINIDDTLGMNLDERPLVFDLDDLLVLLLLG